MGTPRRGSIRLMIVSAAAVGVMLAVPVAASADEPVPVESVPAESSTPAEPADTSTTPDVTTDQSITETLTIDLIVEETPDPLATSDGEAVDVGDDQTPATATTAVATIDEPMSGEHTGGGGEETGGEHTGGGGEETGGEHTGGEHTGGGGQGDPYRITFSVTWRSPDDRVIPSLDTVLPADWWTMFDLAAASATGSGKPTAAHCTYPSGSSELVCAFDNPGHGSGPDGMVVPKKKTTTYTVTVLWPVDGWTIDGANAGPYSAWDLCPRGGEGTGGTHGGEALEGETFVCNHVVVMRQHLTEPPAPEPSATPQPATRAPTGGEVLPAPPAEITPAPVTAVQSAATTPRALPATGNQVQTTLLIGALVVSLGGCLSMLARRRSSQQAG